MLSVFFRIEEGSTERSKYLPRCFLYLISQSYEEIVNPYFLHCYVKCQAPFISSEIKVNQNRKRRIQSCK